MPRPEPKRQTGPKRSFSPSPWESEANLEALRQAAPSYGAKVVKPPESQPPPPPVPTTHPIVYRHHPWWEREDGMAKVLAAFGALAVTIGGVYATMGPKAVKVDEDKPIVVCPQRRPKEDDETWEERRKRQPDICRRQDENEAKANRALVISEDLERRRLPDVERRVEAIEGSSPVVRGRAPAPKP